jgi:hypothetical protein
VRRDHFPFRTEDAAGLGVTRGRLAGPHYRSVFRGVHVAAAVPDSVELRADAALLLAAPGALLCGRTAALLRGLPIDDDGAVHLGVPPGVSRPLRRQGLCPHRDVPTTGAAVRDGRRLVGVPEMWLGFAKEAAAGPEGLIEVVALGDALLKRESCSVDELTAHIAASRWRPGVALARRALPLLRARVDSPMETRTRLVLIFAGLPCPVTGLDLYDDWGEWIGRPDLAYPELRLAFQYEGDDHRTNRRRWQKDIRRDEVLQEHGWYVMRVVADDVLRFPEVFVRRVRERMATQRAALDLP